MSILLQHNFSKAFDRVNHYGLFIKLMKRIIHSQHLDSLVLSQKPLLIMYADDIILIFAIQNVSIWCPWNSLTLVQGLFD